MVWNCDQIIDQKFGTSFLFYNLFYLWLYYTACGISAPHPGIEPVLPAVEALSLNHWTAREVPGD